MDSDIRMAPGQNGRRHRRFRGRPLVRALPGALLAASAGLAGAPAPAATQQPAAAADAAAPRLATYRFWRDPDQTLTEIFAVVPLQGLSFRPVGGEQRAAYTGSLEVRDSTGLVLRRETWTRPVTLPSVSDATLGRATTSEHFSFSLRPGLYTVVLEVADSVTGAGGEAQVSVRAPTGRPALSDLVLASDLVRLEEDAEEPVGSLRRGSLAIVPNFDGAIAPERASVGLFAEIYRRSTAPESAQVSVVVDAESRGFHHETAPQRRIYPEGGGVEAFGVDLTGLPPGSYDLELRAAFGTDTVRAEHELVMLPPGAGLLAVVSPLPYPELSEAEIDSIWAPMGYLAANEELASYSVLSSADAKRRFIARFWERRAEATGESAEALRLDFEKRLEFANREFRPPSPGQKDVEGWETDRGRIYITYGPPAERHVEAQRIAQTNPWEVWRYIQGRGDKYVFWDRTGFGDLTLVYSTNRQYPNLPNWELNFTPEALQFIRQF